MTEVRTHTLSNGTRVFLRPTPGKEVLAIMASMRWGARDDHPDRAGAANLMARLMVKGAGERSAFEIAEALESVGGSIDSFCSSDAMGLDTQTVAADWRIALEVLGDCLFRPTFPADEFDKERALVQADILRSEDEKFAFTYRKFLDLFYRGHLYGIAPEGTVETVGALERQTIVDLHASLARPERVLLVVVGNVPEEEFLAEIEKRWPARGDGIGAAERRPAVCSPGAGRGETLVVTKDVEQAFIVAGFGAPRAGTPESAAMRLISGILGEGMSARLFTRLRDRDHLAYAVGCSLSVRELASHLMLYIGTSPETAEAARAGLLREVEALGSEPPEREEFERARNYILGKFLLSRQTNSALAQSMSAAELLGLGWQWAESFPERIRAVRAEAALELARARLIDPAVVLLQPLPSAS